jgi:hypothetical protein
MFGLLESSIGLLITMIKYGMLVIKNMDILSAIQRQRTGG